MSRKKYLIDLFKEYKNRYEGIQNQIMEINKSLAYTEIGREQAVRQIIDGFTDTVRFYHDKAFETINGGLDALAEQWRKSSTGKLTDGNYQAGLANVIKMLEIGSIRERDDVQNIVDAFKGDFNALSAIKKILLKSDDEEMQKFAHLIPEDNREENKRLLIQLRDNVDRYINIDTVRVASKSWNAFNYGSTGVSMSMDSMAQFVQERLGDALDLLS